MQNILITKYAETYTRLLIGKNDPFPTSYKNTFNYQPRI